MARLLPVITSASWLLAPLAIPVRKIFEKRARQEASPATEEEVQAYIDVGREEGILEKEEEKLLLSIVDFGDTRVREVMTPRTDILWIDAAAPLPVLADLFVSSKYSRIPVVRGSIDTVLGIIHVKDLFEAIHSGKPRPIADLTREAYFVPESKKVSELLREFQRRHLWMAIVVDEYGGVSGLVTVEDLLEEIVGEISDEHEDERESVTKASETRLFRLRQGEHRDRAGALRPRPGGGRVHDHRRTSSPRAWGTSRGRARRTGSQTCSLRSRKRTAGASIA